MNTVIETTPFLVGQHWRNRCGDIVECKNVAPNSVQWHYLHGEGAAYSTDLKGDYDGRGANDLDIDADFGLEQAVNLDPTELRARIDEQRKPTPTDRTLDGLYRLVAQIEQLHQSGVDSIDQANVWYGREEIYLDFAELKRIFAGQEAQHRRVGEYDHYSISHNGFMFRAMVQWAADTEGTVVL